LADPIENSVDRWLAAGIIDASTAERICHFETEHATSARQRWPVHIALALGGLLVCAGILLFVAAHWDELSPAWRFTLVLFLVAAFPVAGALTAEKFPALSLTFHAIGTICVGAGIYLAAQIFNLQEHWPNAILLWLIAAIAGYIFVRHWSQFIIVAVLLPLWLVAEWEVRADDFLLSQFVAAAGLLLLTLTYVSALTPGKDSKARVALVWIGGIALIPCGLWAFFARTETWWWHQLPEPSMSLRATGWILALGVPLLLAAILRGKNSWINVVAAAWVLLIGTLHPVSASTNNSLLAFSWDSLGRYVLAGIGSLGLVTWGFVEKRSERVNLGIIAFAVTVGTFYFSNVMDKLGRSASLISMGALFLMGGWALERVRRRLLVEMRGSQA
jgi:uncharacterized membrane protein